MAISRVELMLDAFEMAIAQCRPRDVVHLSDEVAQYTVPAFASPRLGSRHAPIDGHGGDAYDSTMAGELIRFSALRVSNLERKWLARRGPRSQAAVWMAGLNSVEGFESRCAALGYRARLYTSRTAGRDRHRDAA